MKSISNNTLVALLAVALVVSVSASLYSLTEVSELGGGFDMLTSAAVADVPTEISDEPVIEEVSEESSADSIIGEQTETATCGNGIAEEGETCSTCTLDVKCESGYICESGACVEKKSATSSIIIFLIVLITVVGIAILIYYFTTAKKVGMKTSDKPFKYKPIKEAPPVDFTDFYKKW